jgi:hypothetical protein
MPRPDGYSITEEIATGIRIVCKKRRQAASALTRVTTLAGSYQVAAGPIALAGPWLDVVNR